MNERHTFTVNKNCEIVVELNGNVFKPTGTSEELVKAINAEEEASTIKRVAMRNRQDDFTPGQSFEGQGRAYYSRRGIGNRAA